MLWNPRPVIYALLFIYLPHISQYQMYLYDGHTEVEWWNRDFSRERRLAECSSCHPSVFTILLDAVCSSCHPCVFTILSFLVTVWCSDRGWPHLMPEDNNRSKYSSGSTQFCSITSRWMAHHQRPLFLNHIFPSRAGLLNQHIGAPSRGPTSSKMWLLLHLVIMSYQALITKLDVLSIWFSALENRRRVCLMTNF